MMVSTHPETLPIAVLGANDRMRDTIELFFRGPCGGRYVLCRDQDARITIADVDAVGGLDLLESHRQRYPHQPVIALTVRDLDIDGVQVVRKPIQLKALEKAIEVCREELQATLDQEAAPVPVPTDSEAAELRQAKPVPEEGASAVSSQDEGVPAYLPPETFPSPRRVIAPVLPEPVRNRSGEQPRSPGAKHLPRAAGKGADESESLIQVCCGSSPDVDPRNPEEQDRVFYRPATFLQGYLERAMENARRRRTVVRLTLVRDRKIKLLPDAAVVLTDMSDWVLRPCSVFSMQEDEIQTDYEEMSEERLLRQTELQAVSYDSFLWKVALWSARGRVPVGTDLNHDVELLRWPNFTRLLTIPSFLRISALWSQGSYSLLDTAFVLGILQRHVFALFSACHALRITRIGNTNPPLRELSAEPGVQQRRRLLSRIAQHIQGN